MASTVDICNMALSGMGAASIQSLLDDSDEARACNAVFDFCRDDVMASHPWNFATERVQFSLLAATVPPITDLTDEFSAAYQVPTDTLRVLWIEPKGYRFSVERDGKLLTNAGSPLKGGIIKRITDSGAFPSFFVMALVYRLRAELCNAITGKRALSSDYYQVYLQKLQDAKSTDGLESSPEPENISPIGDARSQGFSTGAGIYYDGYYAR